MKQKISMFIRENTWIDAGTLGAAFTHGWGNGYVRIPKGHRLYLVEYGNIDVDVHGGLIFGEEQEGFWVIGFDTCHWGDTPGNWPKSRVIAETEYLLDQVKFVGQWYYPIWRYWRFGVFFRIKENFKWWWFRNF